MSEMRNLSTLRTPQAVTRELDISPATLRRWADEFSEHLSAEASPSQNRSHRRYTDQDIATLRTIKQLMNDGLTYEQVRQQLNSTYAVPPGQVTLTPDDQTNHQPPDTFGPLPDLDEAGTDEPEEEQRALMTSNGSESPALAFLNNTLATLSDTQQSILNSQAANRELIGVLIQDNFNLKEENNRLRERILEIERSLAQSRQEDEWRREALRQELEAKIGAVQQVAQQAMVTAHSVEAPEIKAIKSKPGCLGALLGGGDTQIVAVPRRRKPERAAGPQSAGPAPMPASPYTPAQPSPAPAHPKPTAPPE